MATAKRKTDLLLRLVKEKPYLLGRGVGFGDLGETHNEWLKLMLFCEDDFTLQAHRGSYKTTCVSLSLAILIVTRPDKNILFVRKTDNDVKEIIEQTKKILLSDIFTQLAKLCYRESPTLRITKSNVNEISTNLQTGVKGTPQLTGAGINGSLTGKHFDYIFTDDIVNVNDRISKAEREHTKLIYQELQNIKNRGGRIFNTGTPWHKDDCFSIMPPAEKFDCYQTGLIDDDKLEEIKKSMTASLFRANYELRHIAEDDVIFDNPHIGADPALAEQGDGHIDAAYGGEDYTAYTLVNKKDGMYYVFGKLYPKHIDDVADEILAIHSSFNGGKIYCETNADKGYLAKSLRQKGARMVTYSEGMNKYIKITSYLKGEWDNVYFVSGTDKAYIEQITDYNENAEHDDAPDSLRSMIRIKWRKGNTNNGTYKSIL